MTYVTVILGILGGIVSLITTGSVSAVNTLKKENGELKRENEDLKAQLAASDQKNKVVVDDAVTRREAIIAGLKQELADAEKNNAVDPSAVHARLTKLLAVP